jgi:hypothetical protein
VTLTVDIRLLVIHRYALQMYVSRIGDIDWLLAVNKHVDGEGGGMMVFTGDHDQYTKTDRDEKPMMRRKHFLIFE